MTNECITPDAVVNPLPDIDFDVSDPDGWYRYVADSFVLTGLARRSGEVKVNPSPNARKIIGRQNDFKVLSPVLVGNDFAVNDFGNFFFRADSIPTVNYDCGFRRGRIRTSRKTERYKLHPTTLDLRSKNHKPCVVGLHGRWFRLF